MDRANTAALLRPDEQLPRPDVADLIVAHLAEIGVEYVFGVPGGAIEPLYNALARSARRGGPRAVTARHEAGAAFMADGYARESGRLGVCIATSGPGATNLITGLACAHDNGVPVLAITGQPQLPSFGRRALQESGCTGINTLGMFRHCTDYDTLLSHPEQAETKTMNAILHACQTRSASHLSIPVDIQRSPAPHGWQWAAPGLRRMLRAPELVDERAVHALHEALLAARRPVFLLGSGSGAAIDMLLATIERRRAAFVTTPDAKGYINPAHPLYHGVFGFAGHAQARELLSGRPDLIVAVGVSMGEWTSGGWSDTLLNERLIHVDATREHLLRSSMAQLHVQGNPASVAQRLLELDLAVPAVEPVTAPVLASRIAPTPAPASPGVRPQVLMEVLSERCPPTVNFIADAGNSTAWAIHHLELNDRRQRRAPRPGRPVSADCRRNPSASWLRVLMDFAPMGWAIGAAVGIALARRGRPVVCLTGDGSYLMNGQEITVAQSEGLPVLFVVLNDGALGMVKHGQRLAGAEPVGFELPRVDFAGIARAMGVNGVVVKDETELAALDLPALLARSGPTLLDVRIDAEQEPPIRLRLETLGTAR